MMSSIIDVAEMGMEIFSQQLAENGQLTHGQANEALVKYVEELDMPKSYRLVKG